MNTSRRSLASVLAYLGLISRRTRSPEQLRGRTLVVAPHPDDEVLGCGGTIAKKVQLGSSVRVVIMTDGRASHRNRIGVAELIALRKDEACRAAGVLGLADHDYRFLGLPDHDLVNHRREAVSAIIQIIDDFQPDEICIPHRRDQLEDHVLTNEIVREALRRYRHRATILEYPVWLWHTWPWTTGRRRGQSRLWWLGNLLDALHLTFRCGTRIDIRDVLERKLRSLQEYHSQIERRNGDPDWPILADVSSGEFLSCFHTGFEIFRQWDHKPRLGSKKPARSTQ